MFHILLLPYWLGADLGVFYASRFVLKPDLSTQARSVALKIMSVLDMGPRVCLVLFLPSGVSLMAASPYSKGMFGGWKLGAVWLLGLAWLLVPRWGALGLASAYAMAFSITSLGLFLFVTRRKACWGAAA